MLDSVLVSLLGEDVVLIVVFVSVLLDVAGDGFTTVVLLSFFSAGGLVTVVSFCSQADSNASPRRRQRYFFICKKANFRTGLAAVKGSATAKSCPWGSWSLL